MLVLGIPVKIFIVTIFCIENSINSVDTDQTLNSVASGQGLHCLYNTPIEIFGLKRLNGIL